VLPRHASFEDGGGWRDQAYAKDAVNGAVATAMLTAGMCRPQDIKPRYPEAALRDEIAIGPDEIWDQLSALPQQYRLAPAHGDLHGENVRVLNGQAILIDLASVAQAPLTVDLAALETWFREQRSARRKSSLRFRRAGKARGHAFAPQQPPGVANKDMLDNSFAERGVAIMGLGIHRISSTPSPNSSRNVLTTTAYNDKMWLAIYSFY
jgi:hypothetical protein